MSTQPGEQPDVSPCMDIVPGLFHSCYGVRDRKFGSTRGQSVISFVVIVTSPPENGGLARGAPPLKDASDLDERTNSGVAIG